MPDNRRSRAVTEGLARTPNRAVLRARKSPRRRNQRSAARRVLMIHDGHSHRVGVVFALAAKLAQRCTATGLFATTYFVA